LLVESTTDRAACPHCSTVLVLPDDESSLAGVPTLAPAAANEQPPASEPIAHAAYEGLADAPRTALFDSSVIRAANAPPSSTPDFSKWQAASSAIGPQFAHLAETHEDPVESTPAFEPTASAASVPRAST